MRIIFGGTPRFAAQILDTLLSTVDDLCAVYTQPDRPAGRGRKLTSSPVKQLALSHHIPVQQPLHFGTAETKQIFADYQADLMIVVAYGLLLPQAVLDIPRFGCINVHASLLPRWRGAAPIQRAILAGDHETGVSIVQMEADLDAGPVLAKARCPINDYCTTEHLSDTLALLGVRTLLNILPNIVTLQQYAQPQDNMLSCYADKLRKEEAIIDWRLSADSIHKKIRAFNPWPVAQTTWRDKSLRIWFGIVLEGDCLAVAGEIIAVSGEGIDIATGGGILRITHIQAAGKRSLSVSNFINSNTISTGEYLGSPCLSAEKPP